MQSQQPPTTTRSASTASARGKGGRSTPTKASGAFSDLFLILQQHGIEHLANHIAECGFGVSDIGNIFKTVADVARLLRVTNKADKARLVGLSAWIRQVDDRYLERQNSPERGGNNNDDTATVAGSISRTPSNAAAVAQQTFMYKVPTTATANEYCRQAATFLEHYRVDRAWPKRRSVLSRTLGLPTGADPVAIKHRTAEHIATHRLYTTGGGGGTTTVANTNDAQPAAATTTEANTDDVQTDNDEVAFKVYQRPARHFSVPIDGPQKAKHEKEVTAREEALRSGKYGGSWHEVGQRMPDKGGPLDPFPTAKGPSLKSLHAMHSEGSGGSCGHQHSADHKSRDMAGTLYETHIVHQHGCQARQCPVCRHHATERNGDGSWQYLAMVRLPAAFDGSAVAVDLKAAIRRSKRNGEAGEEIGDGSARKEELVPMWVPFAGPESIILETAYRKKAVTILVRGKIANLNRMRWNKRPLRRSRAGDVPFPIDHGLRNGVDGSDGDDFDSADEEDALRRAADADRLSDALRESFIKLLSAEEDRSRAIIEAEAATGLQGLKADMDRGSRQIYTNLLENVVREEEIERRAIRAAAAKDFENNILAPTAEQWRQEEVRRLAKAEILAAQKILAEQRKLVELHERNGRSEIEAEENEEWRALERALRQLHAQIALFHQQLNADRNRANQCSQGFDDGTRCAKCLDPNCPFHRKPWASHWRRVGGALDLKPVSLAIDTLDGLVATALDRQYEELGGAGATAEDAMNAAVDGASKGARQSRARGLRGMKYHSTQSAAEDVLGVDLNGNILRKPAVPKRPTSAGPLRSAPLGENISISTANVPSSSMPTTGTLTPQAKSNSYRPQSASAIGRGNATPADERPGSSPRRREAQPMPAAPRPPPQVISSSDYKYPDQVPIRLRRLQESLNKPTPFRHGKGVLDKNDVYRVGEESERSPHARLHQRAEFELGLNPTKDNNVQELTNAPSPSPQRRGSGFGKAAEWGNVDDDEETFTVHKARKAVAPTISRRKNARPTAGDDDTDVANPSGTVDGSTVSGGASHSVPFGFGGVSRSAAKTNDKAGSEYSPAVMSHYEMMRRKNARKAANALPHLQNM